MLQFGIKIKKKVKVIRDTNIYSGETYSSESYERFIDRVHDKKGTNFDDWRQKKESWSKVHELSITKMLCYSILFSSRFMFFFMRLFRYVLKFFFFFLMKKKLHSFISFNCNHAVPWDDFNAYFKLYYVLHQIILYRLWINTLLYIIDIHSRCHLYVQNFCKCRSFFFF